MLSVNIISATWYYLIFSNAGREGEICGSLTQKGIILSIGQIPIFQNYGIDFDRFKWKLKKLVTQKIGSVEKSEIDKSIFIGFLLYYISKKFLILHIKILFFSIILSVNLIITIIVNFECLAKRNQFVRHNFFKRAIPKNLFLHAFEFIFSPDW